MAMRHALGANRWRIARQILTETVLLFLIGGILALLVAQASLSYLPGLIGYEESLMHGGATEMNYRVILFTLGTALLAGSIAGALPALTAARKTLRNTLQALSRGVSPGRLGRRFQNAFVVTQVALALVLLTGAGVLVRNIWGLLDQGFGCAVENRIVLAVDLPRYRFGSGTADTLRRINPVKDEALQQLKALPGVMSAGFANRVPLADYNASKNSYTLPHYTPGPGEILIAIWYHVDSGYFETLGIPLLAGRGIRESDTWNSERVVVISKEIGDRYFQDRDPIGSTLRFWNRDCRIVGIAGETMDVPLHWGDAPTLYFPYTQWHVSRFVENVTFVLHTQLPIESMVEPIRQTLHSIDPQLTFDIATFEGIRDRAMITRRAPMETARILALAAVFLVVLGIYGVLAASVAERTREIGIRMSLGAARGSILRMILVRGGWLTLMGIGIGLVLSYFSLVWMNPLLTGVDTTSPDLLVAASLAVLAIALFASYLPARRALAIDPVTILRYE
jgi:putative ABC transport system permease protein